MIRVFLADDHALVRDGVRRVLEDQPDISVAGEAGTAAEVVARAQLATEKWDVLVLDMEFPDGGGLDLVKRLRQLRPRLPILILTMHSEGLFAMRVLAAGARGFLHKGHASSMLIEAVRRLARGGQFITEELADLLLDKPADLLGEPHAALSDRQIEVLVLLGSGASPAAIAARLDLRASTVSSHIHQIKQKLRLATNGALVKYAIEARLTGPSDIRAPAGPRVPAGPAVAPLATPEDGSIK